MRLVSRSFAAIPITRFRDRLFSDMPWAWEVIQDDGQLIHPPARSGLKIDYKEMYLLVRRTAGLGSLKAMRNRKRIWEYCERILEVVERMEMEREGVDAGASAAAGASGETAVVSYQARLAALWAELRRGEICCC
jgi:hypothetical protein